MPLSLQNGVAGPWAVAKIGVIGPGIVGMPMAALLARARVCEGSEHPSPVVVVQRPSPTSGWKVAAINAGRSPIGGIEPELDGIIAEAVAAGLLRASHDVEELRDADVILVCVQTDKVGMAPDYAPLFEALSELAEALQARPAGNLPLVIFESTLAPSSMTTVVRELFSRFGLEDGRDVLLGNSPNRVMPGRLVERVVTSDKLLAGLRPCTPDLMARLYARVVTRGRLWKTNSLTAEIVKTLENAYRDVRIAYAAELARYCDAQDIDFYQLRDLANDRLAQPDLASSDPSAVPTGGILIPTVGVGGHCLPKDGVLLWWRALESGQDATGSLILHARRLNAESPAHCLALGERAFGPLEGRTVAVLGAAYRAGSEDTRNSPSLSLARLLQARRCQVTLHDPFVRYGDQNLARCGLEDTFTQDLATAVAEADILFLAVAHPPYVEQRAGVLSGPRLTGVVDGCNLYRRAQFAGSPVGFTGIGQGRRDPPAELVHAACHGFRAVERGVANECQDLIAFLNARYVSDAFNHVDFAEVRRLAATCSTGCDVVEAGAIPQAPTNGSFVSSLASLAHRSR